MIEISKKTLIICSIVRNAEKGLRKNVPVLKELSRQFLNCKIFIYENDSIDGTKQLLMEWSDSDSAHVFVSLNDNDSSATIPSQKETGKVNCFYSARRINKMAQLRNHYMNYVEQQNWDADYLMVVDLDVSRLSLNGILSCFDKDDDWDAVSAFGYSLAPNMRKRYHDTYALIEYGNENQPQTIEKIQSLARKYGKLRGTKDWIRVCSAFGGLAIYKFEAVKGLRYYVLPNDDERVEVRCEHYSIYKQMQEKGYLRVFINPQMEIKYQDVDFDLIIKTIKRKLGL